MNDRRRVTEVEELAGQLLDRLKARDADVSSLKDRVSLSMLPVILFHPRAGSRADDAE